MRLLSQQVERDVEELGERGIRSLAVAKTRGGVDGYVAPQAHRLRVTHRHATAQ